MANPTSQPSRLEASVSHLAESYGNRINSSEPSGIVFGGIGLWQGWKIGSQMFGDPSPGVFGFFGSILNKISGAVFAIGGSVLGMIAGNAAHPVIKRVGNWLWNTGESLVNKITADASTPTNTLVTDAAPVTTHAHEQARSAAAPLAMRGARVAMGGTIIPPATPVSTAAAETLNRSTST